VIQSLIISWFFNINPIYLHNSEDINLLRTDTRNEHSWNYPQTSQFIDKIEKILVSTARSKEFRKHGCLAVTKWWQRWDLFCSPKDDIQEPSQNCGSPERFILWSKRQHPETVETRRTRFHWSSDHSDVQKKDPSPLNAISNCYKQRDSIGWR
jgi:hypothetical protein